MLGTDRSRLARSYKSAVLAAYHCITSVIEPAMDVKQNGRVLNSCFFTRRSSGYQDLGNQGRVTFQIN